MTPIPVDSDLAGRLRNVLRAIVRDLAVAIESAPYSDTPGFAEAVAEVLVAVRAMDRALPDYEHDHVVEPPSLEQLPPLEAGCPVPIRLPFDAARALILIAMRHSRALDGLIADVLQQTSADLRRPTVRYFGEVMGRLYTEIMHPLHIQHTELKPLILGTRG